MPCHLLCYLYNNSKPYINVTNNTTTFEDLKATERDFEKDGYSDIKRIKKAHHLKIKQANRVRYSHPLMYWNRNNTMLFGKMDKINRSELEDLYELFPDTMSSSSSSYSTGTSNSSSQSSSSSSTSSSSTSSFGFFSASENMQSTRNMAIIAQNYPKEKYHAEIIARIAGCIAANYNFKKEFPKLYRFFKEVFIQDCKSAQKQCEDMYSDETEYQFRT